MEDSSTSVRKEKRKEKQEIYKVPQGRWTKKVSRGEGQPNQEASPEKEPPSARRPPANSSRNIQKSSSTSDASQPKRQNDSKSYRKNNNSGRKGAGASSIQENAQDHYNRRYKGDVERGSDREPADYDHPTPSANPNTEASGRGGGTGRGRGYQAKREFRNRSRNNEKTGSFDSRPHSPAQSITSQSSRRSSYGRGGGHRRYNNRKPAGQSYTGGYDDGGGSCSRPLSPTESLKSARSATEFNARQDYHNSNRSGGHSYSNQRNDDRGVESGSNDVRLTDSTKSVKSQVFTSTRPRGGRTDQDWGATSEHSENKFGEARPFKMESQSRVTELIKEEARPSPPVSEITDFSDLNSLDTGPLNWSREVEEYDRRISECEREEQEKTEQISSGAKIPGLLHVQHTKQQQQPQRQERGVPSLRRAPPQVAAQRAPQLHHVNPQVDTTGDHPGPSWYQPSASARTTPKSNQRRSTDSYEVPPRLRKNNKQSSAHGHQQQATTELKPANVCHETEIAHQAEQYWPALKGCVLELERLVNESKRTSSVDACGLIALSTRISFQYRSMILLDPEYTSKQMLETKLWKHAFYLTSECLRRICELSLSYESQSQYGVQMLESWILFLDQGSEFYKNLMEDYEKQYNFNVDECMIYDPVNVNLESLIKLKSETQKTVAVKYAVMSCQKYLIAMGDLARYKETARHMRPAKENMPYNYAVARGNYLKAVQLHTSNGKPYNQLGLLARMNGRQLDCVYYLVRCVSTKHIFESANETQTAVFRDIALKVRGYEQQIKDEVRQQRTEQGLSTPPLVCNAAYRREIWRGGTTEAAEKIESRKDKEIEILLQRDASQLYKRCHLYLLHAVGLLITKIDVDQFESIAERGLIQLEALLEREESPLRDMHLIQLTMIVLHCVHKTASKETEEGTCSMQQHRAVQLVFSLWGLLLQYLDKLFTDKDDLSSIDQKALLLVFPAVKLLNSWISTVDNYRKIYSTLPSLDGLETDKFRVPVWKHLVSLCNRFSTMEQNGGGRQPYKPEKVQSGPKRDHIAVTLPEDALSVSFHQVFSPNPVKYYVLRPSQTADQHAYFSTWATVIRMKSVQNAVEFLHGMDPGLDPPKLAFDEVSELFVIPENGASRDQSNSPPPPTMRRRATSDLDESLDVEEEPVELTAAISQLKIQTDAEKMKQVALERESVSAGMIIEIYPTILIPDTNTFIDHLHSLKKLMDMRKHEVLCPFVVYRELEGLSKNRENEWVSEQAGESLRMLAEQVDRNGKVSMVTTKGSKVKSVQFAEEIEYTPNVKEQNDDRILNTCLNFVDDSNNAQREIRDIRDEPLRIIRKVVLLTADRPLRIKATSKDIPARSLPSFIQWLGLKA